MFSTASDFTDVRILNIVKALLDKYETKTVWLEGVLAVAACLHRYRQPTARHVYVRPGTPLGSCFRLDAGALMPAHMVPHLTQYWHPVHQLTSMCSVSEERISSVLRTQYQPGSINDGLLTAEVINVATFWDIAPCCPYVNRRFGRTYRLGPQDGISAE
jgi:hypothetical protein